MTTPTVTTYYYIATKGRKIMSLTKNSGKESYDVVHVSTGI